MTIDENGQLISTKAFSLISLLSVAGTLNARRPNENNY